MATTPSSLRRHGRFTEDDLTAIVTEARSLGAAARGVGSGRLLDQYAVLVRVLRNPAGIGWRMQTIDLTMDEIVSVGSTAFAAYMEEAQR